MIKRFHTTDEAPEAFWSIDSTTLLQQMRSSVSGLTSSEASTRLHKYGPNSLRSEEKKSVLSLLVKQLKSPLILLLLVAAVLSLTLGDRVDAAIIFVIVAASSLIGWWQEKGAADAVRKLLKLVQLNCCVLRDGKQVDIPFKDAVQGDIVLLSAGDMIPGDCLLLSSQELYTDEAAFTGETFPVEKKAGVMPPGALLKERANMLFMGSHVISGTATALIVRTGGQTELGNISSHLAMRRPETEFEQGLRHFGYMLMEITLLLVMIIFAVNIFQHRPALESFLFSLALAVGLTPQLLPAIVAVNLSKGAAGMARSNVIVKHLPAIESLGSMNILCADKTGTITEGKIQVKDAVAINGAASEKVMQYAWINASLQKGFQNPIDEAICRDLKNKGLSCTLITEIPYDFIRRRLTVQVSLNQSCVAISKGAFKNILDVCLHAEDATGQIAGIDTLMDELNERYRQLTADGYRTLGIAYKPVGASPFKKADEKDMVFLGFLVLSDPVREDAAELIGRLKRSGVSLKIITGDSERVAQNIAAKIGMADPVLLTGSQLRLMSEAALVQQAGLVNIFAEVEPNQKERIIQCLRKAGNVVGFMGDGINDAPALHAADVGISVNSAADVAKEAADIVLLSPHLNVLHQGILKGRRTFANTMKYIFMATSANFGNMFSMAGASLFLPFLPLLPRQILLANLLTDLPEMTIADDRVDEISIETPHKWDLRFVKKFMIVFGLISSVFDYLTFTMLLVWMKAGEQAFQTGWFMESVISASLVVLVMRTRLFFFKSPPGKYLVIATLAVVVLVMVLYITPLFSIFGFVKLPASFFGFMILIIAGYIAAAELAKRVFYKKPEA